MKKIRLISCMLAVLLMGACLSGCGMSAAKEKELCDSVTEDWTHVIKLGVDEIGKVQTECDIETNTFTITIINKENWSQGNWHGAGVQVLIFEDSMNSLCTSMKESFDETDLKSEDYTVIINFKDSTGKLYHTSTNGVTTYSAFN